MERPGEMTRLGEMSPENSLADTVAADGVVTLREAILAANSNSAVTADIH